MADSLSNEEVSERIEKLSIWGIEAERLVTRVEFNSYRDAVFFANTVFSAAEKQFHHPKVVVEHNAVEIDIWTHDADFLTSKDFDLASEIEEHVKEIKWS